MVQFSGQLVSDWMVFWMGAYPFNYTGHMHRGRAVLVVCISRHYRWRYRLRYRQLGAEAMTKPSPTTVGMMRLIPTTLTIVGLCLAPVAASADLPLYNYKAQVIRVVDGDTLDCDIDVGFKIRMTQRIRLLGSHGGVNAYETDDKDPAKKALGLRGKQRLQQLLPPGTGITIHTEKDDAFGRYLGRVVLADGTDVGDLMMAEGLAVPWEKK